MKMKSKRRWLASLMAFVMLTSALPVTAFAEGHTHTEECYAKEGDLLCKISESGGHTHTSECVCPGGEYICGLEETKGHTHDESCYDYIDDEESDKEVATPSNATKKELICTIEEQEAHEHTSKCVCPGGEYICGLKEDEGHAHSEDCYAKGGELICGEREIEDSGIMPSSLEWQGEIMTAQDLLDACTYASDGETLTLGADITYDQGSLDSVVISKELTLDCNGHKITVDDALFEIAGTGNLTLVNAQIESTSDDVIEKIDAGGVLTIESTAGDGIVTSDDFIVDNYGTVHIKDGVFRIGYSLVYECYEDAEVIIENADVEAESYIVGYLEDTGCSLNIKNGKYTVGDYIVSGTYGNIWIENGTFHSDEDCFEDIYSGTVTVKDGEFTAGDAENKYYCFDIHNSSSETLPSATVNIEGGTFTSSDCTFNVCDEAVVNISGGTFVSDTSTIYASEDAVFNLSGGNFTNNSGEKAIDLYDNAVVNIEDGYTADPADWNETDAAHIEINPNQFDIVFFDLEGNELYRETLKTKESVENWPAQPNSPGAGYRWWGWADADGTRYNSNHIFTSAAELYAKYVKEGLPDDPVVPDEPTDPETPDKPSEEPTVVSSYDELKAAINAKADYIRISSDIYFPETNGNLKIESDVYIVADEGTHIYGSNYNAFSVGNDVTVTVEGMDIDVANGNVFNLSYNAICNIVSGKYLANDDVINGSGMVNLYGGYIEEKTGSDGPIYRAKVVYKNHTKDGNDDVSIIEVVPCEQFTVTFYNGDEIFKTSRIYEDEVLSLPEMKDGSFIGWFDAEGVQYYSGYVTGDLTLYAAYKKDVVTVTFMVDGAEHKSEIKSGAELSEADGFSLADGWQDQNGLAWGATSIVDRDLVLYPIDSDSIIKTLDEFKVALAGTKTSLLIGAEIPVTETLIVDRSVIISAVDGGSLVRADDFTDALLKIESESGSAAEVTIGNLLIDGRNIEAQSAAISADSASILNLRGTTIRNNFNMYNSWSGGHGGAVYSKGKVNIYEGTTLCSNKSYNGGAVEIDCDDDTIACLNMYGGDICHNSAWNTSGCEGAGGGVHIANSDDEDYVGFYMYGGRIHHNRAETTETGYWSTCDGGGVSLTCGDDGIHFVMYDGEITDNYASGNGGAVYTACSSMAMYGGIMARNVAEKNGGAVSTDCCDNTLFMYGGTITLNAAGGSGGGVDATEGAPYTLLGNVYGNIAGKSGDDVYANDDEGYGATLRKVNDAIPYDNPYYISGEMQTLYTTLAASRPGYIILKPIDGYDFTLSRPTSLQHNGWFEDKTDKRYVDGDRAISTTNNADKSSFELLEEQDVKAVYGGFLLVYDANYGSGEYQYDQSTYTYGTSAITQQNMFDREGYTFIGWNTNADGSGLWYYPDFNGYNSILMNSNKVVYAQWVKIVETGNLIVSKVVAGNAGDTEKDFSFTVKLGDSTLCGRYGDMTFVNGTATFTLKHNEKKIVTGLPAGIRYEVTESEANQDGYTTTATGANGSIVKDLTATAAFTNAKNSGGDDSRDDLGNLIVSKVVAGNAGDTNKSFSFTVKLGNSTISGSYGEMTFANGTATFTLKHNEKKTATGLPAGISYEVTESEANQNGYTTTATGANGSIAKNQTATAAFTNTKRSSGGGGHGGGDSDDDGYGNLTVSKTVSGTAGDTTKAFTFTIKLDQSISGKYGDVTFDKGIATITLKHGESNTAKGLPSGIHYSVTESDNEGYTVSAVGDTGIIGDGKTVVAAFTNSKDTAPVTPDNPDNPTNPDTPNTPDNPNVPDKSAVPTDPVPQTGDESNVDFWLALMIISFAAFTGVSLYGRKRRYTGRHVQK